MIIPLIQLLDGEAVQMVNRKVKHRAKDIWAVVERFSFFKEVQVIDLNGALKTGNNEELIKQICAKVNARVGGGIRSFSKAKEYIEARAKKIIIGTRAQKDFLEHLSIEIGKENIIVALDAINGKIVIEGWRKQTDKSIYDAVLDLENYCDEFLYTAIKQGKRGAEEDFKTIADLKTWTNNPISVALGETTTEEVKQLNEMGVNSVVGLPLYAGKIKADFL